MSGNSDNLDRTIVGLYTVFNSFILDAMEDISEQDSALFLSADNQYAALFSVLKFLPCV